MSIKTNDFMAVQIDDKILRKKLRGGLKRQIPFAMSKAINATAKDAVLHVQQKLPADFTIRSKWVAKGIRSKPSNKRNLVATVGSVDTFMADQETGGTREGGAVPMVGRGKPRPKKTSVTRRSKWPSALLAKSNAFIGAPFGSKSAGAWQRMATGRGKKKRRWLRMLYVFPGSIHLEKKWHLRKNVEDELRRKWAVNALAAIKHAIDTAK